MGKYRLNKAESKPITINNVARTKTIGNRNVVTYSNYITLVPDKVYTSDDEAMLNFFRRYKAKVRYTEALENALKRLGVPYEIEYCKQCGGRIKKLKYQLVEVLDE